MHNRILLFNLLTTLIVTITPVSSQAFSITQKFKTISDSVAIFFTTHEEVIKQDIQCSSQSMISVENNYGNICIKTGWNHDTIALKIIKSAQHENELCKIDTDIDLAKDCIAIKSIGEKNNKVSVDYHLIVPHNMKINLATDNGSIKVKQYDGELNITSSSGNVELQHINNKAHIAITSNGSINIDQAAGPVIASTHNGSITLNNTKESVHATTDNGSISLQCAELTDRSDINLSASGTISLSLPKNEANAYLKAATENSNGKITSEHSMKLKPRITKVNKKTWKELQRNIEGILGNGQASIVLHSCNGPIKILETT